MIDRAQPKCHTHRLTHAELQFQQKFKDNSVKDLTFLVPVIVFHFNRTCAYHDYAV